MRKYQLNESFFEVLNEESTYWLGFLYADGYVRLKDEKSGELKIKLKNTDKNHIDKFLLSIKSNHPIKCGKDNNSHFCQVSIYSNKMVKDLFSHGCFNNKTQKIQMPDLDKKLIPHFVRGYFDGDGSISNTRARPNSYVVSICSNKKFNKDVMNLLPNLKWYVYDKENYSVIKIFRKVDVLFFKDYIYSSKGLMLDRKYNKFKEIV